MSQFTLSEKSSVTTVKCPERLDTKAAQELLAIIPQWIENPSKLYLLDFAQTKTLDVVLYRPFMLLNQALKRKGSFLASINVPKQIHHQLATAGVEQVFSPRKSEEEARAAAGIKTDGVDLVDSFINPFVKATQSALEIQASTKVTVGETRAKRLDESGESDISVDIAAVISLSSRYFNGSIALCFPAKVFLRIYSSMVGELHDTITRDTEDAAGELLNMIFGQVKAQLNDKAGYEIQRAIPAIVRGSSLRVHHLSRGTTLLIPFQTDIGTFHLEMSLETT